MKEMPSIQNQRPKQGNDDPDFFYVAGAMDGNREGGTKTFRQVPDRSCRIFHRAYRSVTDNHLDAGNVPAEW